MPTRGDRRRSRPDAPQVRRPRRHRRLVGLDELDGRLVEPAGERDRAGARRAGARARVHAQPRRAVGARHRRAHGPRRAAAGRRRRRRSRCGPGSRPEYGDALSHRVAKFLGRARRRIRIASPVLTSGPILGTLVEVVNEHRCDVAGVIDETQVDEVFHQWATNGVSAWKIPLLHTVLDRRRRSRASRRPAGRPTSLHDFMHAKVVVADDVTFVGSFNFSRSGERNAENVLEIHDAAIADRLAAFIDEVRAPLPADDAASDTRVERTAGALPRRSDVKTSPPPSSHRLRRRRRRRDRRLGDAAPRGAKACPVFPADNPWNRRVDTLPVAPGSAATVAVDRRDEDDARRLRLRALGRRPDRDPVHRRRQGRSARAPCASSTPTSPTAGRTRSRRACGSRAAPAADGDRHALIVDRDACRLYELYALRRVGRALDGRLGRDLEPALEPAAARPAGRRPTPPGCRSCRASPATTRSRRAASTTRCGSPSRGRGARTSGRRATSRARSTDPALPPMGARLRLKRDFDISGFPRQARIVLAGAARSTG